MTKQEMIDNIYKHMADKRVCYECDKCGLEHKESEWTDSVYPTCYHCTRDGNPCNKEEYKKQVMIGDVLDYVLRPNDLHPSSVLYYQNMLRKRDNIMRNRMHFRKPIDEQSIECITFINLFCPNE